MVKRSTGRVLHGLSRSTPHERLVDGARLFVPVGDHYTLTGEIKNVITVVAKTAHYWTEHLPPEVRGLLQWEARFARLKATVAELLRR